MPDITMPKRSATSRTPALIRSKLLEQLSREILHPNGSYAETLQECIGHAIGAVGVLESALMSFPPKEGSTVQTVEIPAEELDGYLTMVKRELAFCNHFVSAIIDLDLLSGGES